MRNREAKENGAVQAKYNAFSAFSVAPLPFPAEIA
jgi:hypothetical protein